MLEVGWDERDGEEVDAVAEFGWEVEEVFGHGACLLEMMVWMRGVRSAIFEDGRITANSYCDVWLWINGTHLVGLVDPTLLHG